MNTHSFRQNYFLVVIFYIIFSFIASLITFFVNVKSIPASVYNLNSTVPQTVLYAPFVNGTWDHLETNLAAMWVVLIFGLIILFWTRGDAVIDRRFVGLVCIGPIASGLMASITGFVTRKLGGSGTSGIDAAVVGVFLVTFAFESYRNFKSARKAFAIFDAIGSAALFSIFYSAFFLAGNGAIHTLGFLFGMIISFFLGMNLFRPKSKLNGSAPQDQSDVYSVQ